MPSRLKIALAALVAALLASVSPAWASSIVGHQSLVTSTATAVGFFQPVALQTAGQEVPVQSPIVVATFALPLLGSEQNGNAIAHGEVLAGGEHGGIPPDDIEVATAASRNASEVAVLCPIVLEGQIGNG